MTNEELIETLRYCFEKRKMVAGVPLHVWCDRAADALEAADIKIADYTAAIEALDDSNDAYIKENEQLKKRIAELESRLPKEGEWIIKPHGTYGQLRAFCSACGKHSGIGGIVSNQKKPYCPNCGAKMDGERKEQTDADS